MKCQNKLKECNKEANVILRDKIWVEVISYKDYKVCGECALDLLKLALKEKFILQLQLTLELSSKSSIEGQKCLSKS